METGLRLLKILVLIIAALHVLLYFFQEKLIFFPSLTDPNFRYQTRYPHQEVKLEADGASLHALHFKHENPKGLILYFHGNGGDLKDWSSIGDELAASGFDVLIYDYRGYGKSTGRISSESQLHSDAKLMFDYAKKKFEDHQIILFGRSIGTALATKLASQHPVKQVILESPYESLSSISRKLYPYVLPFILKYTLRNDEFAPQVKSPVLILHGTEDEIIPFSSGLALSKRFTGPTSMVAIQGGHHNDLSLFPEYQNALASTLRIHSQQR